ncbi:MAG TPA: glycine-rich protein, partial [Bacteroidia bacterium]|nr:glycine-rich protein [Bacteroidia bacterium]
MKNFLLSAIALFITCLSYAQVDSLKYTGSTQIYIVPVCVDSLVLQVYGASGANANDDGRVTKSKPSKGSYAKGTLKVKPGDTIYVYVGGAGDTLGTNAYNGGGKGGFGSAGGSCPPGYGGGGGGASDVRYKDTAHASRVIIAGGGAGAGRNYCNGSCQPCGGGGSGGGVGGNGFNGLAANDCGFGYPGGDTN